MQGRPVLEELKPCRTLQEHAHDLPRSLIALHGIRNPAILIRLFWRLGFRENPSCLVTDFTFARRSSCVGGVAEASSVEVRVWGFGPSGSGLGGWGQGYRVLGLDHHRHRRHGRLSVAVVGRHKPAWLVLDLLVHGGAEVCERRELLSSRRDMKLRARWQNLLPGAQLSLMSNVVLSTLRIKMQGPWRDVQTPTYSNHIPRHFWPLQLHYSSTHEAAWR